MATLRAKLLGVPVVPSVKQQGKRRKSSGPKFRRKRDKAATDAVEDVEGGAEKRRRSKRKPPKNDIEWPSDFEAEDVDISASKKNRLGQRHRRRIAEKKFGQQAKHIKEGKPAVDAERRKGAKRAKINHDEQPVTLDTEGLHPSWAAKRQQKALIAATPKGTKITFDEEGTSGTHKAGQRLNREAGPQPKKHAEDLHPSWQARKQAKDRMAAMQTMQGAGQHVKFDD